jgi:hypothetical protein
MRMRATLGTALLDKETDTDGARILAGADNGRLGLDCGCVNVARSRACCNPSMQCSLEGDLLTLLLTSATASPLTRAGEVREDDGRDVARVGEAGDDEERREVEVKRGEGGAVYKRLEEVGRPACMRLSICCCREKANCCCFCC